MFRPPLARLIQLFPDVTTGFSPANQEFPVVSPVHRACSVCGYPTIARFPLGVPRAALITRGRKTIDLC